MGRAARHNFQLATFAWLHNFMIARKKKGKQGGLPLSQAVGKSSQEATEEEEHYEEAEDDGAQLLAAISQMMGKLENILVRTE